MHHVAQLPTVGPVLWIPMTLLLAGLAAWWTTVRVLRIERIERRPPPPPEEKDLE